MEEYEFNIDMTLRELMEVMPRSSFPLNEIAMMLAREAVRMMEYSRDESRIGHTAASGMPILFGSDLPSLPEDTKAISDVEIEIRPVTFIGLPVSAAMIASMIDMNSIIERATEIGATVVSEGDW